MIPKITLETDGWTGCVVFTLNGKKAEQTFRYNFPTAPGELGTVDIFNVSPIEWGCDFSAQEEAALIAGELDAADIEDLFYEQNKSEIDDFVAEWKNDRGDPYVRYGVSEKDF